MVKSKAKAEEKMRDRVATGGKYLKEGLEEAPDAIDAMLANFEANAKAMIAGLTESIRTGKLKKSLETAKGRDAWKKSFDRAAQHFEERTEDMVKHAMEDYDTRKGCIEKAQGKIAPMPKITRDQRLERAKVYGKEMGECMDAAKGRKA